VSVTDARGKFCAPNDSWIAADDGYDRHERNFEAHYFDSETVVSEIEVPEGKLTIDVMKGFTYGLQTRKIETGPSPSVEVRVKLSRLDGNPSKQRQWVGGDLHVHMNYGGAYRNTPRHLVQ